MPGWYQSFYKITVCVMLMLGLASCSGGGSSGGSTTAPPPAGSVTVTGTVSGTVIKILRADTNAVISRADTASLPGPPPFPFTLSNIPVGVAVKVFFFSGGQTFPLYVGSPPTNVFTVQTAASIDLGFVAMGGGTATPQNQPPSAAISLGIADPSVPAGVVPLPAILTVKTPASATCSVIVDFAVQNFVIGGQGQQHLHIQVDNNGLTRHFFNGQSNTVLDDSGAATTDVVRQSATSFRINGLAQGPHSVTARLYTASEDAFINPEAEAVDVPIIINPPVSCPKLTITSPSPNASLPSGPVDVSFTVQNFTIGGSGADHLHIYLDGGTTNYFFNGTTNNVLDGNGQPVANITWRSSTSFQITGLSPNNHTIRLVLADAADQNLPNAEANPPVLNISIQAPLSPPTLTTNSPAQGATLPVGSMLVTFNIQNSPVPLSDTQPRMHFYVDGDATVYKFYDGPGIGEEGSSSGVRYQGLHTHFVHWKSGSSFAINGLPSGQHQVRFFLTDANDNELTNPEATKSLTFTIMTPPTGDLVLEPVITGLNFPVGLSRAPDGRIFFNERLTGKIRIINIINQTWQLVQTPFCDLFSQLNAPLGPEQGLLGLALHPDFATNHYVYVYYTAPGPVNRVVRYTEVSGSCTNQTSIIDLIPASNFHNGGIIQFGPDGMLYVFIGEAEAKPKAQDLTVLNGKILRVKPDGNAPADNPFFSNPNFPNADPRVFSYGHRNSFGITFHGHTGDLWEAENGPNVNDEINHIIAGGNYGWDTNQRSGILNDPCCVDPILVYTPPIGPTGIISIPENSTVYPAAYQNNLLFVDYNGGKIRRVVLSGADLTQLGNSSEAFGGGGNALISLMLGADGFVYVSDLNKTTGSGAIFRVVPR